MGIAEAIERVKRQARQSGLGAMIGGVGEHLRSTAVPSPLRGAAWRIANLLDAACPHASADPNQRARELIHQDRAAIRTDVPSTTVAREASAPAREMAAAARPQVEVAPNAIALNEDVSPIPVAAKASVDVPIANVSSARVEEATRIPVREVSATAVDSGASPDAPVEGTAVDPRTVDATPTFNATPVQVEPIDATPTDDAPSDALEEVLEVRPDELIEVAPAVSDARDASTNEPMVDERESARAEVALQVEPAETASAAADAAPRKSSGTEQERDDRAARAAEAARESASIETTVPATDVGELAQIDSSLRADLTGSAADSTRAAKASAPSEAQRAGDGAPKSTKPRSKGQGAKKRSTPPSSAAAQPEKEKLAPSSEDAKNLARSTSRSPKRRPGAKADTSKKK